MHSLRYGSTSSFPCHPPHHVPKSMPGLCRDFVPRQLLPPCCPRKLFNISSVLLEIAEAQQLAGACGGQEPAALRLACRTLLRSVSTEFGCKEQNSNNPGPFLEMHSAKSPGSGRFSGDNRYFSALKLTTSWVSQIYFKHVKRFERIGIFFFFPTF